jgi:hypothetical protein
LWKNRKITKKEIQNTELTEILNFYNSVFGKNVSSTKAFEDNFEYWKTIHCIDKIKTAIENAKIDKFWCNKMTLTILFRKKKEQNM